MKNLKSIIEDLARLYDETAKIDLSVLEGYIMPAARILCTMDRADIIAMIIREGLLSQEQCARLLMEGNDLPISVRVMLSDPLLAQKETVKKKQTEIFQKYYLRLCASYPVFRKAAAVLRFEEDTELDLPAIRGNTISVPAVRISSFGYASFLHMMIHLAFGHINMSSGKEKDIWDIACDISAEALMKIVFPDLAHIFQAPALLSDIECTSATAVYEALTGLDSIPERYQHAYRKDDHSLWYDAENDPHTHSLHDTDIWNEIAHGLGTDIFSPSARGLAPGSRAEKAVLREKERFDLSRYLRRFTSFREEVRTDPDSFDYIPYYYGLENYDGMPFIEPLEYKESFKVETLVIAIDTSGSCSTGTVEKFLGVIQHMLIDHDDFFDRMEVHLIQCDSMIQSHRVIHSRKEWLEYKEDIQIIGRGGTNFRPVFELADKLIAAGEIKGLKGLLYFTDGDGIYPQRKSSFETAFVLSTKEALKRKMPSWIVPLVVDAL